MSTKRPRPVASVAAATLGNALEFYDFTIYAVFAVVLGRVFLPSNRPGISLLLSVATFGVGFMARPLGGIVIGAYADRYGRRSAMLLTMWLMALGNGVIGLMPTYAAIGVLAPLTLVCARLLQGFSAGGEMAPATIFLLESAPAGGSGLWGSFQIASQNIGLVLGGLVGVTLAVTLTPEALGAWGWRLPFLLGVVIAPVALYIRRDLGDPPSAATPHPDVRAILSNAVGGHWRALAIGILVISGVSTTQYFFIYSTTFALTTLGYSQRIALAANLLIGVVGAASSVIGGFLADRFGLKSVSLVPRVAVTVLLYPTVVLVVRSGSPSAFLVSMAGLMALHSLSAAPVLVLVSSIFPASIRTTGLSIAYAVSVALFGGTAQIVFTALIGAAGDASSWVWYVIALSTVSIIATAATKEARVSGLDSIGPDQMLRREQTRSVPT